MGLTSHGYLRGIAVTGPVCAVLVSLAGDVPRFAPWEFLILVGVALVTSLAPVRVARSGGTLGFTLEGGALIAMLLMGYAAIAPLAFVAISTVSHASRTRDLRKTSFNVGRSGLETSAAAAVYLVVAGVGQVAPASPRSIVALTAAAIVFECMSIVVLTELFHRLSGASRLEAARDVGQMSLVTLVGNGAYGLILATTASVNLGVAVLVGLLMPVIYLGYRGYATALEGHRRATALNEISHALLELGRRGDDGPVEVMEQLAHVFGARRGTLVVSTGSGFLECAREPDRVRVTPRHELPRSGPMAESIARGAGMLRRVETSEAGDVIAAPLWRDGLPVGGVMLTERQGVERWTDADAHLLSAMANELSVALDNLALFQQVEEERSRLKAESTKLNDILTAATDGIVSILVDGSIEAWNPGMARITGVDDQAAIGQPWHAVLRLKDDTGTELAPTGDHVISQAVAGQHAGESLSLQALRADGVWRRLECTSSPVSNPDGTIRGVVLVARDVTGERELEELKSDFISTVSHELRTPLTPLKGFLSTLRNPRTPLSDQHLQAIHGAMGTQLLRLETLISDLLAVAEIDHGKFDLRPEPLEISDLVADAVQVEAADELSRCSVLVEPDVTAVADSVALVRIVRSLVSNALKHTTAEVEVTVCSLADHVEVVVRDAGPGIAQWDQQRIFNRFERLGDHLSRTQGPGLGLTIARSLAQRMGGDVELTSDIGRGATFTLTLPPARSRSVPLPVASEA